MIIPPDTRVLQIGPGTLSPGIYSYNALPLAGAQVFENTTDISSYSYNSQSKEFVTYDTPDIVKLKAGYINSKGLAGAMYWELSTDKMGTNSIVGTVASAFGTLDQTQVIIPLFLWHLLMKLKTPVSEPHPLSQ